MGAYQILRRISRMPGVRSLIPQGLRNRGISLLRRDSVADFPDRVYMEKSILPAVVALDPRRVLDVGVETYTQHYHTFYPETCEYWTIDFNPDVVPLARPGRHVLGDVREADKHFDPASIDVVLANGPFGFGIDSEVEQAETIETIRRLLTPRGWMLIGWNQAGDGLPTVAAGRQPGHIVDPTRLAVVRDHFDHVGPGGLPARKTFGDCSHVYDWFRARS
ncbi:class I SAM-dependent methyltransferase [Paludisphaera rhizosphaerae]|uniref:class I SAM-dependent methyltransferase n=1 Tax=Paludisphaera rhizosphaerae TaxID=2711216 RepID=UPI0013EE17B5|nr:class I SAM-dependent methyltransferase [Paludisphaera rhizosphaerae]